MSSSTRLVESSPRECVQVRGAGTMADLIAAEDLLNRTWSRSVGTEVSLGWLRALESSGNYVRVATVGTEFVGTCVGFFTEPGRRQLYSHLAAVAPDHRGRGIGAALKRHQREWARDRGVTSIAWTFDPLARRNVVFNLVTLGARPVDWYVDHYGPSTDPMNAGLPTDRVLVRWPVVPDAAVGDQGWADLPTLVAGAADGGPLIGEPTAPLVRVATPADVARLRHEHPHLALAWRSIFDQIVGPAVREGRVVGATRGGDYVLRVGARA